MTHNSWTRSSFMEQEFALAFQQAKMLAESFRIQKGVKRISLWGCSQTGEAVAAVLNAAGIELVYVYDSRRQGTFAGRPVRHPSEGFEPGVPVIIASGQDRAALQPVVETLRKAGVTWYFCDGLEPETLPIKRFRNCHQGQRCFVVGNGPSLNQIDMRRLKNEITFGSNRVYYGFEQWGYAFTYWAIVDTLVAEDIQTEWNQFNGPVKFIPRDLRMHVHNFRDLCWLNSHREIVPESGGSDFSLQDARFCVAGTVTYPLIQLAMYMGCNPIYLIGVDFNYVRPDHVRELENPIQWISDGDDPNHFFPDYFGKGRKWHHPGLENHIVVYTNARQYAEKHNLTILNATPGTRLDVFDKIDYSSIFGAD